MHVQLLLLSTGRGTVTVIKEPNDPRIASEGVLLYRISRELRKQGYDTIKKLMWKDGHLVSNDQHYVRERRLKNGRQFAIFNSRYQIESAHVEYNREGRVVLTLTNLALPGAQAI